MLPEGSTTLQHRSVREAAFPKELGGSSFGKPNRSPPTRLQLGAPQSPKCLPGTLQRLATTEVVPQNIAEALVSGDSLPRPKPGQLIHEYRIMSDFTSKNVS
jgi:hypothetical protein